MPSSLNQSALALVPSEEMAICGSDTKGPEAVRSVSLLHVARFPEIDAVADCITVPLVQIAIAWVPSLERATAGSLADCPACERSMGGLQDIILPLISAVAA